VLYIDVVRVDRDVTHVVMTINVCFKCMFLNVSSVLDECCKCFIWMLHIHACCKHMFQVFSGVSYVCLQVFHLNIAYVCNCSQMFFRCFRKCFRLLFSSVSFIFFFCMFTLWYLYVSKIDRFGVAHGMRVESGRRRGQHRDGTDPLLVHSLISSMRYMSIRSLSVAASEH
jgi:hypothetical protein